MFGYPLQILPFGRAAGHFKDITVLVAAKEPSTIPLAYTYREGDYATQVDIYIINWREWEEGYFPPPDAAEHRQHQPRQPPCQGNPPNPELNSFSSSSSNGDPSEPTVDLSAWSPRSRHLTKIQPPVDQLQIVNHKILQPLATTNPNPNPLSNFAQISRFLRTCLLPTPAPNPITIKILYSLRTVNNQTVFLSAAQGRDFHSLTYARLLMGRSQNSVLEENEGTFASTRSQHLIVTSVTQTGHMASAWTQSPLQPTMEIPYAPQLNHIQAQERNAPSPMNQGQILSLPDSPYDGPLISQTLHEQAGGTINTQMYMTDDSQSASKPDLLRYFTASECVTDISRSNSKKSSFRHKRKQTVTRRSERLQAKERQQNTTARPLKTAKTNLDSIPFQLNSHETPLEIDMAL